jgi:YD repeat-containing protein
VNYNTNKSVASIVRQLNGTNVITAFGYYQTGTLRTRTNELNATVQTILRDKFDRPTNVIDATGVKITYQYDSLSRLWKVYDPRLGGPITYTYDNFDRVTQIQYPIGTVTYEYDPVKGWLTRQTDVLGRSTHYVRNPATGDILQTVDEVSSGTNRVTQMTYNRFGQLASITPPDSHSINYSYDDLGRSLGSAEVDATKPGTPLNLRSDAAQDGRWTAARNHTFIWGAPPTDSGVAGYSFALDAQPVATVMTVSASAAITNVSHGQHLFRVSALGNNGLWGDPATFNLWVTTNRYTLTVNSAYGMITPSAGPSLNSYGAFMVCTLTNTIVTTGPTQFVYVAWDLAGHSDTNGMIAGTDTNVVISLTNNATLTWHWMTNYWLTATSGLHGTMSPASAWFAYGSNVSVTATPDQYYKFVQWSGSATGNIVSGNANSQNVTIAVLVPLSIAAAFDANLATNGVPQWWLASFGWTNNFDAAALADSDGDGIPNWSEYFSGTSPTNATSALKILQTSFDNNQLNLMWIGGQSATQYIERLASFGGTGFTWQIIHTNLPPTSVTNQWSILDGTNTGGFFRISIPR